MCRALTLPTMSPPNVPAADELSFPARASGAPTSATVASAARTSEREALSRSFRRMGAWLAPGAVLVAATLGVLASSSAPSFYALLDKPAWAPPAAVFGPVWTLLYVLMAVAGWRVARASHPLRRLALGLFGAQLAANAAWSFLFFTAHRGAWALVDIAVLGLLLLATVVLFGRIRRSAGWLMVPVLAWVTFAGFLNASVWIRNPQLLGG